MLHNNCWYLWLLLQSGMYPNGWSVRAACQRGERVVQAVPYDNSQNLLGGGCTRADELLGRGVGIYWPEGKEQGRFWLLNVQHVVKEAQPGSCAKVRLRIGTRTLSHIPFLCGMPAYGGVLCVPFHAATSRIVCSAS
jgi:hypothetical protein